MKGGDPYLDELLVVPLCLTCHFADHHAWRVEDLDAIDDPTRARLLRLAFTLRRFSDFESGWTPSPQFWFSFASILMEIAAEKGQIK